IKRHITTNLPCNGQALTRPIHMISILEPIPVLWHRLIALLHNSKEIIRIRPFTLIAYIACSPITGVWMKSRMAPKPVAMYGLFVRLSLLFPEQRATVVLPVEAAVAKW